MNERCVRVRDQGVGRCVRPLLVGLLLAVGTTTHAEERGSRRVGWEPRVPVGKCLTPAGGLLVNERPGQPWQSLDEEDDLHSRDLLLALPGMKAKLATHPRAVELTLWSNLPGLTEFSGLQSAVVLHDSRAFDLDFTLLRGRVIVANRKTKGAVKVWVRLPDDAWELTLSEPGTEVALELFGRWPRGVGFSKTPAADEVPTHALRLLVLKGQAELKTTAHTHALSEPPGQAYFEWDSIAGEAEAPRRVASGPDWNKPGVDLPIESKAMIQIVDRFRAGLKDRAPGVALRELLKEADTIKDRTVAALTREFALQGLTALDDVAPAVAALADAKHARLRGNAILCLRHWSGQTASHDLTLYDLLMDNGYEKNQAETIMYLLHNPFEIDKPETYETLILYLGHDKLAIRELAHWHLERLTNLAAKIGFDPAAPEAERAKAIAEWKKRIPSGKLPPKDTDK